MTYSLTLYDILELPKRILESCEKYSEYSELLPESIVQQFYYKELRNDLNIIIHHFQEIKYSYSFSYSLYSKTNQSDTMVMNGNNHSDIVSNCVCQRLDSYDWLEKFYRAFLVLSSKLSNQEAVYMVDSFFGHRTEEFISEKLRISRMTLQKIKKSCLVKMIFELQSLIDE